MTDSTREKRYYSVRTGKNPTGGKFDLRLLAEMVGGLYGQMEKTSYLAEAFGYFDVGTLVWRQGFIRTNVESYVRKQLRKRIDWPPHVYHRRYSEEDLFDIIEFEYDLISKPEIDSEGVIVRFNKQSGQQEFRAQVNELLCDYGAGFELLMNGEVVEMPEAGLEHLLCARLPKTNGENVEERVSAAISKFRSRHSTPDDRRDAIRDLADILEFLRPQVKSVLNRKDESDLFNLANNFGIRHHNESQKTGYDKAIWFSWMFYYYLATIHALLRLLTKKTED